MALEDLLVQTGSQPTLFSRYQERERQFGLDQLAKQEQQQAMALRDLQMQKAQQAMQMQQQEQEQAAQQQMAIDSAINSYQQALRSGDKKTIGRAKQDVFATLSRFSSPSVALQYMAREDKKASLTDYPTSYQESVLARQDPGYAAYLEKQRQGKPTEPTLLDTREVDLDLKETKQAQRYITDTFRTVAAGDMKEGELTNTDPTTLSSVRSDAKRVASERGWDSVPQYLRENYNYIPANPSGFDLGDIPGLGKLTRDYSQGFFIPKGIEKRIQDLSGGEITSDEQAIDLYYNWVVEQRLTSDQIRDRILSGNFETE